MPPFLRGEGHELPFSLREKGLGDEGRLTIRDVQPDLSGLVLHSPVIYRRA